MSFEVIRNSREAEEAPASPVHSDGTRYPYAMRFDGDKYVGYADTATELLGLLIDGYADMDPQGQQVARIKLAVAAQTVTQAQINAETDPDVWEALSETEKAILNGPRFEQPHGWGGDDPMGDVWEPEEPVLVLVETGYSPYSDVDRPISGIADVLDPPNIAWIRPVEEFEFLTSLANIGYISLFEATDI